MSNPSISDAVVNYDAMSSVNWFCAKCKLKFGLVPDATGLVTCIECGNTNTKYSQHKIQQQSSQQEKNNMKTASGKDQNKDLTADEILLKQRVVSGIRPTGKLHLGNYFGAIQQFVDLQNKAGECFFFVADLHTLTTAMQDKVQIDKTSVEVVRLYLACGIDPNKAIIYRQSDIAEISYLQLLLSMVAPVGELERCVSYKEKTQDLENKKKLVSLGLLSYPVLMTADILFANADIVPVGKDQEQHLEIAREIARRYNHHFGKQIKFVEPQNYNMSPIKVPGLQANKMSKSTGGINNVIYLLDDAKTVLKKIKNAKTDLGATKGKPMSEEMKNLFQIMQLCSSKEAYKEYLQKYKNGEQKFYGALKQQLAKDINSMLEVIQDRYHNDKTCSTEFVEQLLFENANRVRPVAEATLRAVQQDLGFRKLALKI